MLSRVDPDHREGSSRSSQGFSALSEIYCQNSKACVESWDLLRKSSRKVSTGITTSLIHYKDLSLRSNLSSKPTSQSWNFRPLGGKNAALSLRHFSISMIVCTGSETSSCVGLSSKLSASVAGIDFQNIFMAGVPGDVGLGPSCAVVEYRIVGLRIHMLRKGSGEGVGPCDEGFQFKGTSTSREQHCASMIACSCAVIRDDSDGWYGILDDWSRHL